MRNATTTLILCGWLTACSGGESTSGKVSPAPIPIEDVAAPLGSALSLAEDKQERIRRESFSGVLPEDFPTDVPVYRPATLVDFGAAGSGRAYVVLQTPEAAAVVRARFTELVAARGYQRAADGATMVFGEKILRITYEEAHPGTRIRVEYPSGRPAASPSR